MSDHANDRTPDRRAVERALKRLPFLEREALLLKARDGLRYAEIGTVLGLTAADAEARVASALVRLHAELNRSSRPWWRLRWRCWRYPQG